MVFYHHKFYYQDYQIQKKKHVINRIGSYLIYSLHVSNIVKIKILTRYVTFYPFSIL